MRKIVPAVMVIIMAFQVSVSAQYLDSTLLKDMVTFDKAYIPALVYTNAAKQDSSQIAMSHLLPAWDKFKADNENPFKDDKQWDGDMEMINHLIDEADTLVVKDSSLNEAHLKLELVRDIFLSMRERHSIEYYPDNLITFHALMEGIVTTVQDTKPADLSQEKIERISILLPQATSTWQNVEQSKFDRALFGFSDQKAQTLNKLVKQEQASLDALKNALDSGDKSAVIKAAKAIKPAFVKIYMLFGDFNMKS